MAHLEIRADDPIWKQIGFDEAAISSVTESIDDHWEAMVAVTRQMGEPDLLTDLASQFSCIDLTTADQASFGYVFLHKIDHFGLIISSPKDVDPDDAGFSEASRTAGLGWLIKLRNYCRDTPDPGTWTAQGYANYQSPDASE